MPYSALHLHQPTTFHHHPYRPHLAPLSSHIMDVPHTLADFHCHKIRPNQCSSTIFITIPASLQAVWSVVRGFENPQSYKPFLKSCSITSGNGSSTGSLREVLVVSGLPATTSLERLEMLDDEKHVISFSIVGGDHRLVNYRSVTTLHLETNGCGTVVVESYIVDVPTGNTRDETIVFVDTIVRCNLESLARVVKKKASFSTSSNVEM